MEEEREYKYMRVKDTDTVPPNFRGKIGVKGDVTLTTTALCFNFHQWVFHNCEVEEWNGPDIEQGKTEEQYFVQDKLDRLRKLAFDIALMQPSATNFKLWYDAYDDFHRLSFELDGGYYEIQYYKVFCMSKDREKDFLKTKNFYIRDWDIVTFFARGKHKEWVV